MAQFRLFSEDDLDRLAAGVFRTLAEAGVLIQDETIRAALAKAGAMVGGPDEPVRLPRKLVEDVIAEQVRHQAEAGREPAVSARPRKPTLGTYTHVAQFFYDWRRQERRAPTVGDFLFCLRFGDVHDPDSGVGQMLLLRDFPPVMQNLEALYLILQHANHVGGGYVHYGEQVPYLAEMGRIWAGDPRRFLGCCIFAATPLRFDERACGVMRAMAGIGLSPPIGTMVTSGASSPVTPAGAIVVAAAEILAGMAMQHALGAPAPRSAGIATGSLDLRRANSDFASPEAMLQDIGITELFDRRFGGRAGIWGCSNYTCATVPGIQAACERCFEGMWCAIARGGQPAFGSGLIESGKTLCLEQLLIDEEVARMSWHVARGIEVSDETMGLSEILEIGTGSSGRTHLETEHTLRHMREAWAPALFDRGVWAGAWDGSQDRKLLDRAHEIVLAAVARYSPPSPDEAKLRAVRKLLDGAARKVHG
jgi:trimethylamine--corrinoid protein Co-methyltransferase